MKRVFQWRGALGPSLRWNVGGAGGVLSKHEKSAPHFGSLPARLRFGGAQIWCSGGSDWRPEARGAGWQLGGPAVN